MTNRSPSVEGSVALHEPSQQQTQNGLLSPTRSSKGGEGEDSGSFSAPGPTARSKNVETFHEPAPDVFEKASSPQPSPPEEERETPKLGTVMYTVPRQGPVNPWITFIPAAIRTFISMLDASVVNIS